MCATACVNRREKGKFNYAVLLIEATPGALRCKYTRAAANLMRIQFCLLRRATGVMMCVSICFRRVIESHGFLNTRTLRTPAVGGKWNLYGSFGLH
jgi:hypothetical protein